MTKPSLAALILVFLFSLPALGQLGDSPWFLGLDGGVYVVADGRPKRLGLASGCSSLAVAAGVPWATGADGRLWTTPGERGAWVPVEEGLQGQQVVAGDGSALFLLGLDGGVYQRLGEGNWRRVGLGTGTALAVGTGSDLYLVGQDQRLWRSRGADGRWSPFNALARGRRVTAGSDGSVYLLGTDGGVYRVTSDRISRLGLGTGRDLAVSPSGRVYLVGTDNGVWSWDGRTWTRLGTGTAKAVAFDRP